MYCLCFDETSLYTVMKCGENQNLSIHLYKLCILRDVHGGFSPYRTSRLDATYLYLFVQANFESSLSLCLQPSLYCFITCLCLYCRSLKRVMASPWVCGQKGLLVHQKTSQKKTQVTTLLWSCIGHCQWQSSPSVAWYPPSWLDLWVIWKGGKKRKMN